MKKNAEAAAAELDKRWEAAKASLAALDPAKGADWDAAAAKVEAETIKVNEAIDALEASLKKK